MATLTQTLTFGLTDETTDGPFWGAPSAIDFSFEDGISFFFEDGGQFEFED